MSRDRSEYRPAAICRRGHVATTDFQLSPELAGAHCRECGAEILRACPGCGNRIRGDYYVPGVMGFTEDYTPPDFCEDCASPFPWLSRQGRIYVLQSLLDEADISEADKLRAREQLDALIDPDLDQHEEARRWARFSKAAPTVWAADRVQKVVDTMLQAGTRALVDKYTP